MDDAGLAQIEQDIRGALDAQGFMKLVGAEVVEVGRGRIVMALDRRPEVLQQYGFFHGGAVAFLVDNATAAAAGTTVDRETQGCVSAEYKMNFVAPANGERIVCEAEVVKPGRRLCVVEAKVFTQTDDERKLCANALATIAVIDRPPMMKPS